MSRQPEDPRHRRFQPHQPSPHQPSPHQPGLRQPSPRIPLPQPTRAEREHEHREAVRAAMRKFHQQQKEAHVPPWGRDLLRVLGCSAVVAVAGCILILLVRWRLLLDNSYDVVDDTELWAAIVAMLMPLLLPFLLFAAKRPDSGFRFGAVPFLPVVAVVAGVVQALGLLTWPWLVGADLVPGTVLADLFADPVALVSAAAVVFTWTCVFLGITVLMVGTNWVVALWVILPFLGAILGAAFTVVPVFTNPSSLTVCLLWVGLGAVALVALTVLDIVRSQMQSRKRLHTQLY